MMMLQNSTWWILVYNCVFQLSCSMQHNVLMLRFMWAQKGARKLQLYSHHSDGCPGPLSTAVYFVTYKFEGQTVWRTHKNKQTNEVPTTLFQPLHKQAALPSNCRQPFYSSRTVTIPQYQFHKTNQHTHTHDRTKPHMPFWTCHRPSIKRINTNVGHIGKETNLRKTKRKPARTRARVWFDLLLLLETVV